MDLFFLNDGSKLVYIIKIFIYVKVDLSDKCSAYLIIKWVSCNSSISYRWEYTIYFLREENI